MASFFFKTKKRIGSNFNNFQLYLNNSLKQEDQFEYSPSSRTNSQSDSQSYAFPNKVYLSNYRSDSRNGSLKPMEKNSIEMNEETDKKTSVNSTQNQPKMTLATIFCLAVCAAGCCFQFGWNIGVYNTPVEAIKSFFNRTYTADNNKFMSGGTWTLLWSVTNGLMPLGGVFGGVASGWVADRFGRKKSLLIINVFVLISGILSVISKPVKSYTTLIIARFFTGLHSGLFSGVAPMYLSEIPPRKYRGAATVLNQLTLTIGILVTNALGLPVVLGTDNGWPYLVGITFVPMVVCLVGLPFCVESPKFMFSTKNNPRAAEAILTRLRGSDNADIIRNEMEEMAAEKSKQTTEISYSDLFKTRKLLMPLVCTVVIQIAQQFSGINAVMYYSTSIFTSIGLDKDWSAYATIILAFIQVLMTFVSMVLVEIAGRRLLLLIGLSGMSLFCFILAISRILADKASWLTYLSLVSMVAYIVFFSIGPGAIPWLITVELFDSSARGKASSIAVFINWFANFLVTVTFPFIEASINNYSFLIFGGLLIGFSIFVFFRVPETKNKTPEEINEFFN